MKYVNCNEIIRVQERGIKQKLGEYGITGSLELTYYDYARELCRKCKSGCSSNVIEELDRKYLKQGANEEYLSEIKKMVLTALGMLYSLS